jgi:hypothetical protein
MPESRQDSYVHCYHRQQLTGLEVDDFLKTWSTVKSYDTGIGISAAAYSATHLAQATRQQNAASPNSCQGERSSKD